ncbi:ACT domain-containing protein [Defluviimonas salinarum]|uniref:ACT domain-containing protein n=1 Tax=Defluviimonas salinarum TaxID=2992147 RepID=A0ABT3J0N4_9RHOB|nr:ACT domain-containing protein [Defluviimonas salinarum]
MSHPVFETRAMIAGMSPELLPGSFVFCSLPGGSASAALLDAALSVFREAEGQSLILPKAVAAARGLDTTSPMRLIRLNVHSSLEGVGLTAAVATALAAEGIACNMVAAYHHDHAFVPADRAAEALEILLRLQGSVAVR